jgi:hypothetical protein
MDGPWALPAGPGARGIAIDDIEETEEGEEGERRSSATVVSAAPRRGLWVRLIAACAHGQPGGRVADAH